MEGAEAATPPIACAGPTPFAEKMLKHKPCPLLPAKALPGTPGNLEMMRRDVGPHSPTNAGSRRLDVLARQTKTTGSHAISVARPASGSGPSGEGEQDVTAPTWCGRVQDPRRGEGCPDGVVCRVGPVLENAPPHLTDICLTLLRGFTYCADLLQGSLLLTRTSWGSPAEAASWEGAGAASATTGASLPPSRSDAAASMALVSCEGPLDRQKSWNLFEQVLRLLETDSLGREHRCVARVVKKDASS